MESVFNLMDLWNVYNWIKVKIGNDKWKITKLFQVNKVRFYTHAPSVYNTRGN